MSITTIAEPIPRDRYQRPLVVPPGGDKPVPYTRCTTYVGCLEDTFKLGQWQQRMVAIGLSMRPDLQLAVAAHRDDRDRLDQYVDDAREAAAASASATTGTALHALTERIDRGQEVEHVPAAYLPDIDAYRQATARITAHHIETFMVNDELRIGGTPDRIGLVDDDPQPKIIDVKTGSIEYSIGKIAMQLAVYAHSQLYDHTTQTRTPIDIDTHTAIVVHLPAGTGRCELVEVDIARGWAAVEIATSVRGWRKVAKFSHLAKPIGLATTTIAGPDRLDGSTAEGHAEKVVDPDRLSDAIAAADSIDQLTHLWNQHAQEWSPQHTELAIARKSLLLAHAV